MNGDSLDTYLTLVADRRRRRLLEHLRDNGNSEFQIDDLVDQLYQAGPTAGDDQQMSRDELAIQLHHSHLPRLADHGVVEYDHDYGTIEYHPDKQIGAVLDGLSEEPSVASL